MNPAWQGASLRDAGSAYRLSRCVLLAHEDKIFQECFGCINEHSVGRNTLATVIAGLVCAADFAKERAETSTSDFILEYAAWLELVEGFPRHYVRINPTNVKLPGPVRCRRDGVCFERVEPAFQRYVVNPGPSRHEIWSFRHQLRQMPRQKILRIIVAAEATVAWSADHWATANKSDTMNRTGLNLWFADLATKDLPDGSVVEFTFFWEDTQRWEGRNWQIDIEQL